MALCGFYLVRKKKSGRSSVRKMDHSVLIMGACPTGLEVIRNLGQKGIKVWALDPNPFAVGFYSKYCQKLGVFDPNQEPGRLLETLIKFAGNQAQKPVVMATSDLYLVFLAQHSEELKKYFLFTELNPDIIEKFLNKKVFYQLCLNHNIMPPATFFMENSKDVTEISKKINYPCIIKPIYIHLWDQVFKGIKVLVNRTPEELVKNFEKIKAYHLEHNIMFQEMVEGKDQDIYIYAAYFDKNHQPVATFSGRKIRQFPPKFGVTVMAIGEEHPEFKAVCTNFLEKLNFQGLCDVEFKLDAKNKEFKIMEINPRAGRWYGVVESCGLNLPYLAYLDLIGKEVPRGLDQQKGKRWIHFFRDFLSSLFYFQKKELSLGNWLNSLKGPRKWAIYSSADPFPFLASSLGLSYRVGKSLKQAVGARLKKNPAK